MHDAGPDALVQSGSTLCEGRFLIIGPLGKGGMGAVFEATDAKSGDAIAIKVLHPHLAREERVMARFRREADVVSRLQHPHIVRAIATGQEPDGLSWIAMERVDGPPLSRLIRESGVLVPQRAVRLLRQILAGVGAAHAIGVLHRDLKPGNVVIAHGADGVEIAKVVDFGIARLTTTKTYEKLTATGQVIGTPAYMSPEQALGGRVDERSDLYAVGAIACVMLTGAPPFGRGKLVDVLPRLLRNERTPLTVSHAELGALATVVERALAERPEHRFATVEEMDAALVALDDTVESATIEWQPPVPLDTLRLPFAHEIEPPATTAMYASRTAATLRRAPEAAAVAHHAVSHDGPAPARQRRASPWLAVLVLGPLIVGAGIVWVAMLTSPSTSTSSAREVVLPRARVVEPRAVALDEKETGSVVDGGGISTLRESSLANRTNVSARVDERPRYRIPTDFQVAATELIGDSRQCHFALIRSSLADDRSAFFGCAGHLEDVADRPPYEVDVGIDMVHGTLEVRSWRAVRDRSLRRCLQTWFRDTPAPRGCILEPEHLWRIRLFPLPTARH